MVMTGTIGAQLHISFPLLNRLSFGFCSSYYFMVFSCVILALFWFSSQVRPASSLTLTATLNCPDIDRFTGDIPGAHTIVL